MIVVIIKLFDCQIVLIVLLRNGVIVELFAQISVKKDFTTKKMSGIFEKTPNI